VREGAIGYAALLQMNSWSLHHEDTQTEAN